MNPFFLLILILTPLLSWAETLEGIAKNQKGEVIYLEKHTIQRDSNGLNKFIRVEYTKPDGSLFATMISDFSKSKTIPETIFEDTRFKTKSSLRLSDKTIEFEEFKNEKVVSKKSVPLNESMVASQGFDNFIKMNFSELENRSVDFNFGILEKKDFYSLTGYKRSTASATEIEYGIKASSWFLRLFANELRVAYDAKTKQLKTFSGRSNILDDFGQSQDVTISYQWKSEK